MTLVAVAEKSMIYFFETAAWVKKHTPLMWHYNFAVVSAS